MLALELAAVATLIILDGFKIGMMALDSLVTDSNSVIFDVANNFAGCIAGCHEVLRRQGLMTSIHCSTQKRPSVPDRRTE